jgi:hypothetical protein
MPWLKSLVVLLCFARFAQAQDQDAEKLYRNFEKKLVAAKSFNLVYELNPEQNFPKAKGDLTVAAGNKMKHRFTAEEGKQTIQAVQVSDGKTMASKYTINGKPESKSEPTPKDLTVNLSTCLARGGLLLTLQESSPPEQAKVVLKDFRMKGREKLGDQEAKVVQFTLRVADKDLGVCTVWFESKSGLPLKRTLQVLREGKLTLDATNVYTRWQLEPGLSDTILNCPSSKARLTTARSGPGPPSWFAGLQRPRRRPRQFSLLVRRRRTGWTM